MRKTVGSKRLSEGFFFVRKYLYILLLKIIISQYLLFLRFLIFNNLKQNWKQFLTLEEQFRSTISSTIKFSRNGIIISGFLFPKSNLPSFVPTGLTVKTWNSPFVLVLELWDDFLQLLTGIPQSRKRCTLFKTYCNIKSMNKPMCLFPLSYIY